MGAVVLQDPATAERLIPAPVGTPAVRAPCVARALRREPGAFEVTDFIVDDSEQPTDGGGISVVVGRLESSTGSLKQGHDIGCLRRGKQQRLLADHK